MLLLLKNYSIGLFEDSMAKGLCLAKVLVMWHVICVHNCPCGMIFEGGPKTGCLVPKEAM